MLSTFVFVGLRIGELAALRIVVRESKTDAGVRQIDLLPVLRDELVDHKGHALSTAPDEYVFATISGTEPKQSNIRRRVLDRP